MAARALGTASISFGLVSIPVKLYSTNQPASGVSFNMLHKTCGSRVKQQYVCPTDNGQVVERDDIVKGYEFSKGRFVTFTPEELEALEAVASESIDIAEFVPAPMVDPVYYDKAYYLGPDKGADRAYKLLIAAMKRTDRAALASYAARGKQYLVLLRPIDDGLVLQQLRYADEVKSFSEVPVGEADVKDKELDLAVHLIEQISTDEFHPEKYRDEVKDRTLALIQRKIEGEQIVSPPASAAAPQGQVIDLMEALKASLQKALPPEPKRTVAEPEVAKAAEPAAVYEASPPRAAKAKPAAKEARKGPKAAPRAEAKKAPAKKKAAR